MRTERCSSGLPSSGYGAWSRAAAGQWPGLSLGAEGPDRGTRRLPSPLAAECSGLDPRAPCRPGRARGLPGRGRGR
eukprot:13158365-Alexandrium_andersonii.AAC.1